MASADEIMSQIASSWKTAYQRDLQTLLSLENVPGLEHINVLLQNQFVKSSCDAANAKVTEAKRMMESATTIDQVFQAQNAITAASWGLQRAQLQLIGESAREIGAIQRSMGQLTISQLSGGGSGGAHKRIIKEDD